MSDFTINSPKKAEATAEATAAAAAAEDEDEDEDQYKAAPRKAATKAAAAAKAAAPRKAAKAAAAKAAAPRKAAKAAAAPRKAAKAAAAEYEDEEQYKDEDKSLEEHKSNLRILGKHDDLIKILVSTTSDEFNENWPKNQRVFSVLQWQAAKEIFVNSSEWVRKDQNVYLNEIRERALLFIVNLTNQEIDAFRIDAFPIDESIKQFLKQLRDKWIGRICDCRDTFILKNYPDDNPGIDLYLDSYDDNTFNNLIRKGGRSSRWDFELKDTNKDNKNHSVKIELKFSSTGKSRVDDLSQFVALNLEGTVANSIFGESYLAFFHEKEFLKRMVDLCNDLTGEERLEMPTNINNWKKAAAATSPPAKSSPEIKTFFEKLREINKNKKNDVFIQAKKDLVNVSFKDFIQSRLNYLNGAGKQKLQDLLNTQVDKFFCIFTSNDGANVECIVDQMQQYEITKIESLDNHTFLINTSDGNNILVGLSWGNGGAGINNPRAMFKLYKKEKIGGSGKILRGGSDEIDLPEDDPELEEDVKIFNDNTSAILTNKPSIDKNKITEKLAEKLAELKGQQPGMQLRSGFIKKNPLDEWMTDEEGNWIKQTNSVGGKSYKIFYSKNKSVKSKRIKRIKITKKNKNKTKNKKSKKNKYKNNKTKTFKSNN